MKFLRNVFWNGLWRIRTPKRIKFFNRIKWFLDDKVTIQRVRQAMLLEKVETLRQKLNEQGIHGLKRERKLATKRRQIRNAIMAHIGRKRYYELFPIPKQDKNHETLGR